MSFAAIISDLETNLLRFNDVLVSIEDMKISAEIHMKLKKSLLETYQTYFQSKE